MARLDRRVVSVWRWSTLLGGLSVAIGGGFAAWLLLHDVTRLWVLTGPVIFFGTAVATWLGPPRIWSHWFYEIGEDALEFGHGLWFQEHSVVPWSRVQHVDISHGPLDRRHGLAQLKIHTASAKTDAKLPGIEAAEAERLRLDILDRYRRATEGR